MNTFLHDLFVPVPVRCCYLTALLTKLNYSFFLPHVSIPFRYPVPSFGVFFLKDSLRGRVFFLPFLFFDHKAMYR